MKLQIYRVINIEAPPLVIFYLLSLILLTFVENKSTMFIGLQHLHSMMRWLMLAILIFSIVTALIGWLQKKPFTAGNKKIVLYTVITAHLQLLTGFALYYLAGYYAAFSNMAETMSNAILRFFSVEHMLGMLVAIIIITIGSARSKKATDDVGKHKVIAVMFGIALLLILLSIPWPFREAGLGRGWF